MRLPAPSSMTAPLGGEGGGQAADRLWVVDPIDGTSNFARGLPEFAVSIGFCDAGKPVLGVIGEPATGAVYAARLGGGGDLATASRSGSAPSRRSARRWSNWVMPSGIPPRRIWR